MGRSLLPASPIFKLVILLTVVVYASGQCPASSLLGNGRYSFYPSVTSGQDFVFCAANISSSTYSCPDGFVYNPRKSLTDDSSLCLARRSGPFTFDCSQNGNGSYSGDNTLYATCQGGNATMVNECPKGWTFMKNTRTCEIVCSNVGSFGLSNSEYYTCTYNYRTYKFTMTNGTCNENTRFRRDYSFCLNDEQPKPSPGPSTSTTTADPNQPATSTSTTTAVPDQPPTAPWGDIN